MTTFPFPRFKPRKNGVPTEAPSPDAPEPATAPEQPTSVLPSPLSSIVRSDSEKPSTNEPAASQEPPKRTALGINRNPQHGAGWWRNYVDPAIPDPEATLEDSGLQRLIDKLEKQHREPTAGWLIWMYFQQLQISVKRLYAFEKESCERLNWHNDQVDQKNARIDVAQQQVQADADAQIEALQPEFQQRERRAKRAEGAASARAGRTGVGYNPEDPIQSLSEFRGALLRDASGTEEKALAVGEEKEATYLLEEWPEQAVFEPEATPKPGNRDIDRFHNILTFLFVLGVFISVVSVGGIVLNDELFALGWIADKPLALLLLAPCYAGLKGLGQSLSWLGEKLGASWFRSRTDLQKGSLAFRVTVGLGLAAFLIDTTLTRTGLMKAATNNTDEGVLASVDQISCWLIGSFFVLGYIVASLGGGVVKQWRLHRYEVDCQQRTEALHELKRRDLQATIGAARKRQLVAEAKKETAPRYAEVMAFPETRKLATACNRAALAKNALKELENQHNSLQTACNEQLEALEKIRPQRREAIFDEDATLIERIADSVYWQNQRFRAHLSRIVHETELPWPSSWLRRYWWFGWFWESRRVSWQRFKR